MSLRLTLFLALLLFYILHDLILSKRFKAKYGKDSFFLGKKALSETQRFLGKVFYLVLLYYAIVLLSLIIGSSFGGLISFIAFLDRPVWQITGFLGGTIAVVMMILARMQLGSSWRVGLDASTTDPMVTRGLYRFIRNPYYTFLLTLQFSLILVIPNAIAIFAFIQSLLLLKIQVYQEEAFLQDKYGERYAAYKKSTGRFLPQI